MADYIYLLETRLSPAQQRAIGLVRSVAREVENTLFLTGGAVRDLTGGGSIRDLDLTLQGDPLKLSKTLEQAGAQIVGDNAPAHQLFMVFPGGVRVELAAAMSVTFPKPGKPKYSFSNMTEDLRRRDFTANAMAISLNEGSYGLLMDPLNGVADIENRELRLVSSYGFIEDPSRLVRAARLSSRLGWQMEEKTRARYDTAKDEGYISAINPWNRGYELEEIFHEDDPLRVLRALEAEGWMTSLFAPLRASSANTTALAELADKQGQLQAQGIVSLSSALAFPLVTGKMPAADTANLKELFVRPGFLQEVDSIESQTRDFATKVAGKEFASPAAAWKLLHSSEPNLVLSLFYSSKSSAVQARLKTFLIDSPTARQRIPYAMIGEMRITPDMPVYTELIDKLFFELMDGRLSTPEEMKAYLEPFSPPAPPPPVNLRRARARKEARPSRAKVKKAAAADETPATVAENEEAIGVADGLMEEGELTGPDRGPEPTISTPISKVAPEIVPSARPGKKQLAKSTAAVETPVPTPVSNSPSKSTPAKATPPEHVRAAANPVKAAPPKSTHAEPAIVGRPAVSIKPDLTKSETKKAASKDVRATGKPAAKKTVPAKKSPPTKTAAPVKAATKFPTKLAAKKASPAKPAKKTAATAKKASATAATSAKPVTKKAVPAKAPAKVAVKVPTKGAQKITKKPGRR